VTKGKLIILSGPSGVGKDTVINAWRAVRPEVVRVVAYTTREPRLGEQPGIDYHFVSVEEFNRMATDGEFLEWKQVHTNFYATPLKDMQSLLDNGKVAILKIDVQGALAAMERRKDAISIFLLPPSWEELERRIRGRKTDDEETIRLRLENARHEMDCADQYHFRVVNDDVDRCVEEIDRIVTGEE
jgi:guanylate kinase